MPHIEETRIGGMTVRIDRLICVGFGDCIEASPDAFAMDDEGIAVLRAGADSLTEAEVIEACRSCPVDALLVLGPNGEQIVP